MPPRPPEVQLRRLIAELASSAPGDVEAVLGELEPRQRVQAQALLQTFVADGGGGWARAVSTSDLARKAGLSPWLAERLDATPASAGRPPSARRSTLADLARGPAPAPMTEFAIAALRAAVLGLQSGSEAGSAPLAPLAWRGPVRRLFTSWGRAR